jgi:hypothetical protein
VIRLPGAKLPSIPERSSIRKKCFTFGPTPNKQSCDLSYLLEEGMGYISLENGMSASIACQIDEEEYVLTCSISVQSMTQYLIISAAPYNNREQKIATEQLQISELSSILDLLKYRDTLPNNILVKFVNSFKKFAQYFLLPFIRVNIVEENGQEVKKMELWSSPNAVYYQDIEADVFGQA